METIREFKDRIKDRIRIRINHGEYWTPLMYECFQEKIVKDVGEYYMKRIEQEVKNGN